MKAIQSELKEWKRNNNNLSGKYLKIKQEVLNNPEIKKFLSLHPHLTKEEIDKKMNKLHEYITQSKHCTSIKSCPNILKGYRPNLYVENNKICLSYEKSGSLLAYEKQKQQEHLIKSLYIPKEILSATTGNIEVTQERTEGIRESIQFLEEAEQKLPLKGIYLYGPFGTGKTYFLGALANRLKEINISSMLIYMPEFVREMKVSLKDNSLYDKLNYFKRIDVLMLDDIGAEMQSPWFRDEILGSILQYRMMEELPLFFTSNFSMEELENLLANSSNGGNEMVKAARIMERIRRVSKEVSLFGKNRRETP